MIDGIYGIAPFGWKSGEIDRGKGNRLLVDIAKNYTTFDQFTKFSVKCGKNIRFWEDRWCDNEPLQTSFPDLYSISGKKGKPIIDCWDCANQSWNLDFRRGLFDREIGSRMALVEKLNNVQLDSEPNRMCWQLGGSGTYRLNLSSRRLLILH